MAQIFHPAMNTFAKASIFGSIFILAFIVWAASEWYISPYWTQVNVARTQPVMFSHEHHVSGLGIDCRYCHTSVEEAPSAGIPSTKVCMSCHSQLWTNAEMLEPIRQSWRSGRPVQWTRVYDLPDYSYFDHSIHVSKGIGCATCHGEIHKMPLTWKATTLHMSWCLDCHRHPENYVRPRDKVFDVEWQLPRNQAEVGRQLVEAHKIVPAGQLTNCSICHR